MDGAGRKVEKTEEKKQRRENKTYPHFYPQAINEENRGFSTDERGYQFLISSIIPKTREEKSGSVAIAASTLRKAAMIVV